MSTQAHPAAIDVTPAKRFFVEMLTRDIELEDAILDLLDNCLDGAIRTNARKRVKPLAQKAYEGYWAEITLNENEFRIKDNCGGISTEVAKEYAFKFGRPRANIDTDVPTVGVYGIGMKRALFKLGRDCLVTSHHSEGSFTVHIDEKWLTSDTWKLNLKTGHHKVAPSSRGVEIIVKRLNRPIGSLFSSASGGFKDILTKKIRDHYAYIIQKGFKVKVNGEIVRPAIIHTLVPDPGNGKNHSISPYIYETDYEGVSIKLVMGMYAQFPTESEVDDLNEGRRSKTTAGWTIICNDRVVLSHDTTHRTGWGEAGVPAYHSQFVMLAGVVEFTSTDAEKLPVTTTKRGINLDSPLYASVKDVMREALKHFTSFTYHWKSDTEERATLQKATKAIDIRNAATSIPAKEWQEVRKSLKGRKFVPELPKPAAEKTHARITFERPLRDIAHVRGFLEYDDSTKAADVGAGAFDWVLAQAKS